MYFVPLSQLESVELVVHALKAAGGEADCKQCPAYKVCMKQCLSIANSIGQMLADGSLPQIGADPATDPKKPAPKDDPDKPSGGGKGRLKVVK